MPDRLLGDDLDAGDGLPGGCPGSSHCVAARVRVFIEQLVTTLAKTPGGSDGTSLGDDELADVVR